MSQQLSGKVALVTGGTSGIGRATAIAYAQQQAKVVVGRRMDEGKETVRLIHEAGGEAIFVQADVTKEVDVEAMASLQSVRACADKLLADGQPFDSIIANAGVMATPFSRTVDGFEVQFATNHLGHFALINQIEPLLADNGRLVVLSSLAHRGADIDLDDPNFEQQAYDPWVAYSRSKTANSLFAVQLRRLMTRPTRLPTA
jgi:NAD(P)-dependent dehydrogenase (short-subunit alcohol dehydrogenase family)